MGKRAAARTDVVVALAIAAIAGAGVAAAAAAIAGCSRKASGEAPPGVSTVAGPSLDTAPIEFSYESLDDRPVTAQAMRGKPAVLVFVTTWDLSSQAQVDFLVRMAKKDEGRVAYAMIALQERQDRELVEVYSQKLGVTFPVALGDKATISGGGPFGDVHNVPTIVVLDRAGRVAWEKVGLTKSDEIRAALASLRP